LWDDLYEAAQRPLIDSIYTFSLVPWQMRVFAIPQNLWGVGPWQQRVIPMMFGLLSLFILWRVLNLLCSASLSLLVTVYFALSYLFFNSLHVTRPEPIILFFFLVNLWWLVSEIDNRLCSTAAGMAFSLCFNLHPNVIIPLCGMVLAVLAWENFRLHRCLSSPRYAWWTIGLAAGTLWYISGIDIESAVMNLQWAKGVTYSAFPICRFQWDVSSLLLNMSHLMRGGSAFHDMLGLSIGLSLIGLRRYSQLSRGRQFIATTNLFLLVSYACFAASLTFNYSLYVYPWVILCTAGFIVDYVRTPIRFNKTDLFIVCCSSLFFMEFDIGSDLDVWLIYPLAWLLIDSIRGRTARQKALCIAIILCGLLPRLIPSGFAVQACLRRSIVNRAVQTLIFFILPIVILKAFQASPKKIRIKEGVLFLYALLLLILNLSNELRLCMHSIQASRMPSDLETVLTELQRGKRIIGPAEIWLYQPSNNLRSDYVLSVRNHLRGPVYSPLSMVRRFKPDIFLLDEQVLRQLMADARVSAGNVVIDAKRQFQLFGNPYREAIFTESQTK